MHPSLSFGPPSLSASWSPPPFCGIEHEGEGDGDADALGDADGVALADVAGAAGVEDAGLPPPEELLLQAVRASADRPLTTSIVTLSQCLCMSMSSP